jgi:hypothetical protein
MPNSLILQSQEDLMSEMANKKLQMIKEMWNPLGKLTSKSSHFISCIFDFSIRDPKFVQFLLKRRSPLKEPAGSANSQSSS